MPRVARPELVVITLRLRKSDVDAARAAAGRTAVPYQHVIRSWVADAAKAYEDRRARLARAARQ